MRLEPFIARRLSHHAGIPVAGIAVGVTVMLMSLAIAGGFKREVSDKVIGFVGDARVLSLTQDQYHKVYPLITDDTLMHTLRAHPDVAHMQTFAVKAGMLKTDDDFLSIQLMGVGEDYDTTFLCRYLVQGRLPHFAQDGRSNELLISRSMARALRLQAGDRVFAYFLGEERIRARRFDVIGIYETHLAEYDKVMAFTDINTVRKLLLWEGDQASGIEVHLREGRETAPVVAALAREINGKPDRIGAHRGIFSAEELVPHTFAWLDVLDANVVMILLLMALIAAFTIVSGLLVEMLEQSQLIGTLTALGASAGQLRGIFRRVGLRIVLKAMLLGDVAGWLIAEGQRRWKVVKLDADTYYLDAVPMQWNWAQFLAVNVAVIILSAAVVYGTSFLLRMKGPASAMRWE